MFVAKVDAACGAEATAIVRVEEAIDATCGGGTERGGIATLLLGSVNVNLPSFLWVNVNEFVPIKGTTDT